MKLFTERLRHRLDVWWAVPGGLRNPSAWKGPLHRLLDTHRARDRDWSIARWQCCAHWQRCLNNKLTAREYAAMHGVATPDLLWSGRRLHRLPVQTLPTRFVVRRAWGAGARQTHLLVDGMELLDGRRCSPQQLHRDLLRQYGRWSIHPLLVEEFLEDAAGRQRALEVNLYCFGGRVGLIEHIERAGRISYRCAYDAEWHPFAAGVHTERPRPQPLARPAALDQMVEVAGRLAATYGTFVRVDLYLTSRGLVFGEFSSTPFGGKGISPWADELLGRMWEAHCPAGA